MSSPSPPADPGGANGEETAVAAPVSAPPAPRSNSNSNPELDIAKLQSLPAEQQELFLFTFVSTFSQHVLALSAEDCTAQQMYLKREVFQIISLTTPAPGRVVRNNLGRCLAHFLGRGDRKLLFETINDLVAVAAGGGSRAKGGGEGEATVLRTRHAAVCCLGDVYAAAGDSAIGLHQLVCSTLLKVLKGAHHSAGLRAAVFVSFAKIVGMIETSMDEAVARDLWKQARSYATGDKGALVVVSAFRCLAALMRHTSYFDDTGDFDNLKSSVFKAVDFPSERVRHAAADCLAEAFVKGYSESATGDTGAILKLKRPKTTKAAKRLSVQPGVMAPDEDDAPARSESPGPSKRSQLLLSLADIFRILSTHYVRLSTTNRARAAIGICYGRVLQKLDEKTVETNYLKILEGLTIELLGHTNITNNRYRLLMTRHIVDAVLQDVIGHKILGESGQTIAAKLIINDILKNYPQALKERPEPTKDTLVAVLGALDSLICSLGSAANNFAESCRDGLLQVLQHPSYTVQVHASSCMKTFVLACPQQLLPCLSVCMNSLNRELGQLGSFRQSYRRCIGFSHGLAATLSASPQRPLYGSVDINSRVLTMATDLLKSSGKQELRVAATQIQVAWTLIGGLMSLGPSFVKIHLSQLLLLWKNALPKPLAKDNTSHRNALEASFLTHVRECALGSILAFLQFNIRLLTVDVSKRIATMLQSTTAFLKTLPSKKTSEDVSQRLTPALQLQDLEMMVQRRVLQCYIKLVNLSPAGGSEALIQSNLLTLAVSLFADPDNYTPSSLTASIANAASTFETIWEVDDNEGFGVTGLISGFDVRLLPGEQQTGADSAALPASAGPDEAIERLLRSPVCGTLEHDASLLYIDDGVNGRTDEAPDPPATEVVNMAIQLFAFVFPLTPAKVQESILEQITTFVSAGSAQREAGRKAAVSVNVAVALLSTLKVAAKETQASAGDVASLPVEKLLQEMLRDFVLDPDQYVRSIGYQAVGRLCNVCGNAFTNHEIKYLVDTIVGNREPSARAGCAMNLGFIQTKVGGMAAGYHLKTILGVLMSLCNDPHPTVHFWALQALALAADAVGLGFSGYVSSTLGMLAQLYVADTHNDEVASAASMNLEVEHSTPAAIARCIDSLINVLGPDLQDSVKSRELILTLVRQFQLEDDVQVQRAGLNCLEHLSLYAPGHVAFTDYVRLLQSQLGSNVGGLRDVAVDGLYNLMKRNSYDVLDAAQPGFEEQLWSALDFSPGHDGVRNIIRNWVRQTCLGDTAQWLQRFQAVLKMTRLKTEDKTQAGASRKPALPDLRDEEVAGFAVASGVTKDEADATPAPSDVEPIRWQVTAFAMDCLNEVFVLISKDVMVNGESPAQAALQSRIGDVVRMAFSASTSGVLEQRIWGLKLIGAVLRMFGRAPDPDFDEAMLLEQYQAQISSALTPAFAADSSPELAAEAVNVCALFVATGIVSDVDRMGRILKTLVGALDSFAAGGGDGAGIGDLRGLSANAQVMVKMAVFAAWAELQVAATAGPEPQRHLQDVLRPRVGVLAPLWLESLREFARLRFEPDISMTLGPPSLSGSLDTIYAALNRETLLRFYQDAWLRLVDAIASLIEQDSAFVFDALDGGREQQLAAEPPANGTESGAKRLPGINYRDEPVAFFFVLFGIAFEALAAKPGQADSIASREQTLEILRALRKILHPSVSGLAIYREAVFAETMDLLDRLVLTEGLDVQGAIVEIARQLCVNHPAAVVRKSDQRQKQDQEGGENDEDGGELSEDIEQLFELTRIIVLVLSGLVPNLANANTHQGQQALSGLRQNQMTDEAMTLVKTALNALVDAAEVFPSIIRTDLHACIVHIFATMLATPSCQQEVVPMALPTLRRFVTTMASTTTPAAAKKSNKKQKSSSNDENAAGVQLQGCLRRFLSIYLHAQKREAPTSLACVKNCLLAITVLFTGGDNRLSAEDPLVTRFLDDLVDCLTDRMTARIAANCIRSLLVHQTSSSSSAGPSPADLSIARYLLPRLIAFTTNTEPDDPEGARGLIAAALTQWAAAAPTAPTTNPRAASAVAIALVVPTLLARAAGEAGGENNDDDDNADADAIFRETGARLLELAAVDAAAFRSVVAGMSEGQKQFMEDVVAAGRRQAGGRPGAGDGTRAQPTIALKMNFGA